MEAGVIDGVSGPDYTLLVVCAPIHSAGISLFFSPLVNKSKRKGQAGLDLVVYCIKITFTENGKSL